MSDDYFFTLYFGEYSITNSSNKGNEPYYFIWKRPVEFESTPNPWKRLMLPLHYGRKLWEISLPATSFTPRYYKIYEIKSQDPHIGIEPISAVYKTAASPQCL